MRRKVDDDTFGKAIPRHADWLGHKMMLDEFLLKSIYPNIEIMKAYI